MTDGTTLSRARDLALALIPAASAGGVERLDLAVSVGAALALSKTELPVDASPLLRAAHTVLDVGFAPDRSEAEALGAIDDLRGPERADFLGSAASFVAPRLAIALADALEHEDRLPHGPRLAALLVELDAERCERLLSRWRVSGDPRSFDEAVATAIATSSDAGASAPPGVLRAWRELESRAREQADEGWFSARLLVEARRDPVAALPLLEEAIEEHGASAVSPGLTSLIARVARRDTSLLEGLLDGVSWVSNRSICLAALTFDGVLEPASERRLQSILEAIRSSPKAQDRHPRLVLDASLALLELAAATGRADLAEEIVEVTGPSAWMAAVATQHPARRRALRERRADSLFGTRLRATLERVGPGLAAQVSLPETSLAQLDDETRFRWWELETLPLADLPWWNSWGTEPP